MLSCSHSSHLSCSLFPSLYFLILQKIKIVTICSPWCHSNPVLLSCSVKKRMLSKLFMLLLSISWKQIETFTFIMWKQQYEHPAKRFLLCSTEDRKLHGFGTTWGWVNDDRFSCLGELSLRRTFSSVICYSLTFTNTLMVDGIRFSNSIYLLLVCCESTFIKSKNVCTARWPTENLSSCMKTLFY